MATQVAEVLNSSRALAMKGDMHEAVAILLRKRHELQQQQQSDSVQGIDRRNEAVSSSLGSSKPGSKALLSAIEVINSRVQPLLNDLRANACAALGVGADTQAAEAKKAYRKLALRFHPDKSEGTTDLFHCIQEAFERFQSGGPLVTPQQPQTSSSSSFSERFRGRQRQSQSGGNGRRQRGAGSAAGSGASSTASNGVGSSGPLQTPKNLRMIDHSSASVTVCWDPPPGATPSQVSCYELQFKEGDDRDWQTASNSLSRTSCQKHNLKPATTYKFRIRALSSQTGEWSPFSGSVTASTMAAVPPRPRIISVTAKTNLGTVHVVWESGVSAGGGPSKYVFEFRPKKPFSPWIEVEPANEYEAASCTRILRDLSFTRPYQFRVRAQNQVGTGPWSVTASYDPPVNSLKTRSARKVDILRVKPLPNMNARSKTSMYNNKFNKTKGHTPHTTWSTWDDLFQPENDEPF